MLLVCPGLLAHAAACGMRPAFARLAYYAEAPAVDTDGIAALVGKTLGLADPPVAALTAAGSGLDTGNDYWLVADPVMLVPGRTDVALAGRVSDLSEEETHELLMALNAHFLDDGLRFVAPRSDLWLAHLGRAPDLITSSVDRARSVPLAEALPRGAAGPQWRRWQDEIQMLLHNHPVNAAREAEHAPVANAVWFWGGGRRFDAGAPPRLDVNAPENALGDLLRGIAAVGRAAAGTNAAPRRVFVHERVDDVDQVDEFVARVLEPALAALEQHEHPYVDLVADGAGAAFAWRACAPSTLQRLAVRWRARAFSAPHASGQ